MKPEPDKKEFRKFIKDNSDMLSTLGIFSALTFSVSSFVPGYIGLILSISFALAVVIFLLEISNNLIETRLIVSAVGKLFGVILLTSVSLLFLHLLLYTYTGTEFQDSVKFYVILALLISMTTIAVIYSIFINYGYENNFLKKPSKAARIYNFLCITIFIISFLISYAIYKNFDDRIKNYIQNNYSLNKTKSI